MSWFLTAHIYCNSKNVRFDMSDYHQEFVIGQVTRRSQSIEIDIRNQSTSFVDYYRLISEIVEIKVMEKRYRLISILFILIRILDFQKGVCCIKQKEIIFKGFKQALRRWTNILYRSRNAFWVNTVIASVHFST